MPQSVNRNPNTLEVLESHSCLKLGDNASQRPELQGRPVGGSSQIVDITRKSAAPEAREIHLLPREKDKDKRKIKWSPSVFLENFKLPAFTLAFRDNVARSMTEMIERYVDINFTSSELANQRRIKGNLDL